MRLYVYYRVPEDALATTVRNARAMQARLSSRHSGLACELLRRPEVGPGGVTLMETYAGPPVDDAFVAALQTEAAALPQPRHVERFEPLAS